MKKFYPFILLVAILAIKVQAQNEFKSSAPWYVLSEKDSVQISNMSWAEMMQDPSVNFYTVQQAFNTAWAGRTPDKGKGYKPFRRWEAMMTPRVYPTGERLVNDAEIMARYKNFEKLYKAAEGTSKSLTGAWTSLGANVTPTGSPSSQPGGNGRVNCIAFNPKNSGIMYVGAPSAGLWRSKNGGTSWAPVNDTFAVVGVSSVVINHIDTSIMYIATGDGDAGDTYTVGIMKSTNSGRSWHYTSFHPSVQSGYMIRKLVMHPTNPDIMWAATNGGVLKTTDGWATYTVSSGIGGAFDIELKPGDPTIVYASTYTGFYKSTDGGVTFTAVTLPTPPSAGFLRIAIAVCAAAPANVYVVCGRNDASPYTNYAGFGGFYKSTDSGASFSEVYNETSANHNLLGWSSSFGDTGGQSWYDLEITVNPGNANEIYIGGVNICKSTNGGTTWGCNAYWTTGAGYPYCHADHHAFAWLPGSTSTLFNGNDGGIFKTTNNGSSWTDISNNLCLNQLWGMGISKTNSSLIMTGWQDNGVNKLLSGSWTHIRGGDGMEVMCTPGNDTRVFGSYAYGDFYYSTNGGTTWSDITPTTSDGEWVTPIIMDPSSTSKIYAGYASVYYNGNATPTAANWSTKGTVGGTGNIIRMALAPSASTTTMYVIKSSGVYKTTNLTAGTPTWTDVTGNLPVSSAMLTYIAVDQTDANRVYVTFSGYSDETKVFMSTTGGTTWTNISYNLPNLPINCIVVDTSLAYHPIYVGGDVGVYFKDDHSPTWVLYSEGLPNVVIKELEIFYGTSQSSHRLRAGTYGRGVWESDLYEPPVMAPSADFEADKVYACEGATLQFTDLSLYVPTSWTWTFPGGSASSTTVANPTVTYNTAGTYPVTLVVSNGSGSDTLTKTMYITIGPSDAPFLEDFGASLFAPAFWSMSGTPWKRSSAISATGGNTTSALFDCYNLSSGATGDLISPAVDLTPLGSNPVLIFNVSYRQYSSETDKLQVFISNDCGSSWTSIYNKSGATLSTGAATTSYWRPAVAGDWRQESTALTAYANQSVMLKFTGTSNYGNNIWIDDVELTTTACSMGNAGTMSGTSTVCQGQTGVTYSIAAVSGATTYEWSVPSGASIVSGNGSTSIVVDFSASAVSGYVNVKPKGTCGYGASSSGVVVVNTIPGMPDSLVGPATVCQGQTGVLFYVPEIWNYLTAQDGYVWSLPSGASISAGSNTDSVYVDFSTSATSGIISVHGNNSCGAGAESPLFAITVNPVPAQPSAISGNINPCASTTGLVYSVTNVTGVTYTWTVPSGWTITAGQGSNSITVTSGTVSGVITVTPANACGNGTAQTLTVSLSAPAQPSPITGSTSPCQSTTGLTYNVTNVSGVTYTWVVPAGWSITAGQGSNSITVTSGTAGGTITVTPNNGCSSGTPQTLSVSISPVPAQPSAISGTASPCPGTGGLTYSVTSVAGVTYTWTVAAGWSITAGQGSNSITVISGSAGGNIQVVPSNACGNGTAQVLAVSLAAVPAQPSAIIGNAAPCQGATGLTYSVTNVSDVSYSWSLPTGWTQTGGGTGNTITVSAGTTGGTIMVTPANACGNGTPQTLTVSTSTVPAQPSAISGVVSPCPSTAGLAYSVTNTTGVTYTWALPTGWVQTGGGTSNSITVTSGTVSGSITVTPSNGCGNGTQQSLTVSLSAAPAIVSSPSNSTIGAGGNTSFTVSASGTGLSYQWQLSTDGGSSFSNITSAGSNPVYSGWTTATLSLTGVVTGNNGYLYRCVVSGSCSPSANSSAALLSVNSSPAITSHPSDVTVCSGTNTSFTVAAIGSGLTHQWQISTDGGTTFNNITAAGTNPVYSGWSSSILSLNSVVVSNNGYQYRCVVDNGVPPASVSNVATLSVNDVPAQPSAISGVSNTCQNTSGLVYQVPNVSGVSYSWSVPSGWSINSGQGTSSVTVTSGTTGGIISVTPSNSCGNGTGQTLSVSMSSGPSQPTAIAGNSAPCPGTSGLVYSVTAEAGVTYSWTVPSDWTITAGQGTNSITVTSGTAVGSISVTPDNSCGTGTAQTLTVSAGTNPAQPSTISGTATPCANAPGLTYSVTQITGITYTWSLPSGWSITSGQGTNSIVVTAGTLSGIISVTPSSSCGTGTSQSLTVNVGAVPMQPVITGQTNPCSGSTQTYSVPAVAGETYNWSYPAGYTLISGQGTASIDVIIGSGNGNISVVPINSCGLGTFQNLGVIPVAVETPAIAIGSDVFVCNGEPVEFTASVLHGGSNPVISWYLNGTLVANGSTYSLAAPVNGDGVYATLISDAPCVTTANVQSANVTVTVYPEPATPVITQSGDTLYSSFSTGNQWYNFGVLIPGEVNYFIVPSGIGDFSVVYTDNFGCTSTSADYYFDPTGIRDIGSEILVYPNPSENIFTVKLSFKPSQPVRVVVTNMLGEPVMESEISDNRFNIDLSSFPDAVYFLTLVSGDEIANIILVKE